jgi:Fic family protein
MVVPYILPEHWIRYDVTAIASELIEAKAAIQSLTAMPFQRSWAEAFQEVELKREVAGTSRIEGADFTEKELEEALSGDTPVERLTRSQRQARSAVTAYLWIAGLDSDRPIDESLIKEVHRRIVTGCDDDHCPPGELRGSDHNVTFGRPRHRGVEGGADCQVAFKRLCGALNQEFRGHDPLIQALALHYHLGAMHPFHDGNGRTARALEAFVLQRARLKDALFIAMSNYYYDEKPTYLSTLSEVRRNNHDLTPFLKFGLSGIALQCQRLLKEIRNHVARSLFRDVMGKMYARLRSTRKRALAARQYEVLGKLLDKDQPIEYREFYEVMEKHYRTLRIPARAYVRDLNHLLRLGAITVTKQDDEYFIAVRLDWATEITETQFFREINRLPEAKTRLLVSPST